MPRPLTLLIQILLSAGLIGYAFSHADVVAATTHLRGVPSLVIAAALAVLFLGFIISALRLRMLLGLLGGGCTLGKALDVVLIGAFFSQALVTFVGGDAMRIWRMVQAKTPIGLAFKGVIFDRLAGFCGLITIILIGLPRLVEVIPHPAMRAGPIAALLVAIAGVLALFFARSMPAALRRWKLFRWIAELSHAAVALSRSKSGMLLLVALSAGIHLLNVLAIYLISRGLGMEVGIMTMVALIPPVLLLSLLPISVAGWGVREGAMVVALNLVGVPPAQSLALSICFGLCALVVSLPGGALWFASRRRVPADDGAAPGLRTTKQ